MLRNKSKKKIQAKLVFSLITLLLINSYCLIHSVYLNLIFIFHFNNMYIATGCYITYVHVYKLIYTKYGFYYAFV